MARKSLTFDLSHVYVFFSRCVAVYHQSDWTDGWWLISPGRLDPQKNDK